MTRWRTGLLVILAALSVLAATAVPASADSTPSPSTTPVACPDPAFAPTGLNAGGTLSSMDTVQATIRWDPFKVPAGCSPGQMEIQQVTPTAGASFFAAADAGMITVPGLRTLTAYTWRLRLVAGTVSEWGTVTMPQVLPLDYCLGLPGPRTITGTALSPTSVHLEWGKISYPEVCGQTIKVTSTPVTPTLSLSVTRTGVDITGLTPGTSYTWTVAVLHTLWTVTVVQPFVSDPVPGCSATLHEDRWGNGLVGSVTVRNTSASTLHGWTVGVTLQPGVRVDQLWGGTAPLPGSSTLTVTNASWNGALAPDATTSFGYLASFATAPAGAATLTCTAA